MICRYLTSIMLSILTFSGLSQAVIADTTTVTGTISSSVTWTKAESPYKITDSLIVADGVTLTIEPGVEVRFETDASLTINGTLNANGTESDSILFVPSSSGRWHSIMLNSGESSMSYCRIEGSDASAALGILYGGAIRVGGAGTVLNLAHSVLTDNRADQYGGAVCARDSAVLVAEHCSFSANEGVRGGAIAGIGAFIRLTECNLSDNDAPDGLGGALYSTLTDVSLDRCTVARNTATFGAPGISVIGGEVKKTLTVENCTLSGNTSASIGGGAIAIYENVEVTIDSCLIHGNDAGNGAGVRAQGGNDGNPYVYIHASTIAYNATGQGIWLTDGAAVSLNSCIVYGNAGIDTDITIDGSSATPTVTSEYSLIGNGPVVGIEGGWPGTGNKSWFTLTSFFTDVDAGDFTLLPWAPVIDVGDPAKTDADGSRADMGLFPFLKYVVINEVAFGNTQVPDEDGDASDYVELMNRSAIPISLTGWGLSPDPNTPMQWVLPDTTIQPGAFVVIWASGKDRTTGGVLHANFDNTSVSMMLSDATGKQIDKIDTGLSGENDAIRRRIDGTGTFIVGGAKILTPGFSNLQMPPRWDDQYGIWGNEGEPVSFVIGATDVNDDSLVYTVTYLPDGVTFNMETLTLSMNPGFNDARLDTAAFEVTDGFFTRIDTVFIYINNVNRPPGFDSTASLLSDGAADRAYIDTLHVIDLDNETLTFEIIDDAGLGLAITDSVITHTGFALADTGLHVVTFAVRDPSYMAQDTISLTLRIHKWPVGVTTIMPTRTELRGTFPNPFNPVTTVSFSLAEQADVTLTVYNTLGQPVRTVVHQRMSAGFHAIRWNGRDNAGRAVSSGVYLVRMTAGTYTNVMRVTMVR
jgi:hypothetical protein